MSGITAELYENEYRQGAGGELSWEIRNGKRCPPKINAVHSSSALVVNSFAPWKLHLHELELCRSSVFRSFRFETKAPTGLGGTPPHLDFLAESVDNAVVAAESKFTEYLQPHRTEFAQGYSSRSWPSGVEAYVIIMQQLQESPSKFAYLDAAQLVKHAFGLASLAVERNVTLLYLYWEPDNGDAYPEFELHRKEAEQFAGAVGGSSVKFWWKSYVELWNEWALADRVWLRSHSAELMRRYSVKI